MTDPLQEEFNQRANTVVAFVCGALFVLVIEMVVQSL